MTRGKEILHRPLLCRVIFVVRCAQQRLYRVLWVLCRVLETHGKTSESSSESRYNNTTIYTSAWLIAKPRQQMEGG